MEVKVRIVEVLERVVEVKDVNSVEEAVKKVRDSYRDGDPVLTADDFSGVEFFALADEEGVCPVCGGSLAFLGVEVQDDGGVEHWECKECGATGLQGYNEVFDGHHYDVRDKNGTPVPGRGGY